MPAIGLPLLSSSTVALAGTVPVTGSFTAVTVIPKVFALGSNAFWLSSTLKVKLLEP